VIRDEQHPSSMTAPIDWDLLERLRKRFLEPSAQGIRDYWESGHALAQYEATFAQRIRWKWDAVLAELRSIPAWDASQFTHLCDWGCGTGIATRATLHAFSGLRPLPRLLFDRSERAMDFASSAITNEFSGALPQRLTQGRLPQGTLLLLSHVLDELPEQARASLRDLLRQAEGIIWVEPGTSSLGRDLPRWRDELMDLFRPLAPCPHEGPCGLQDLARQGDWCHFFAPAPAEAFTTAFWGTFSRRMGIDLRALPISYLVMTRRSKAVPGRCEPSARVLGRPRFTKGRGSALVCYPSGPISHLDVRRSKQRQLYDILENDRFPLRLPATPEKGVEDPGENR
jgi:hypothetical protein